MYRWRNGGRYAAGECTMRKPNIMKIEAHAQNFPLTCGKKDEKNSKKIIQKKQYKNWKIFADKNNIIWAIINAENKSANTLSKHILGELENIIDSIENIKPKALVIRSEKENGFVAGAEISEFESMTKNKTVKQNLENGLRLLNRLESLPYPTIAVIHGFCLGGGLELALACSHRIARKDAKIGFPEVLLGLHPGLGGTHRMFKITAPIRAINMMITGKTITAKTAKQLNIVDIVTEERHIEAAVNAIINQKSQKEKNRSIIKNYIPALPFIRNRIAKKITREIEKKASKKHYPAPYALVSLWEKYGFNLRALEQNETQSFVELMQGETAQNLIRIFHLRENLKKQVKNNDHKINHVHVIGAGTMGGDIAAWCALNNFTVTIQDISPERIAPAVKRAHQLFTRKLKNKADINKIFDQFIPDPNGNGLKNADLVIEAASENINIKNQIYKNCARHMKKNAILATNTSSLLLENLRKNVKNPTQFAGLHFFNPVAKMTLVELVTHDTLKNTTIQRLMAFTKAINRLPVKVKSAQGFFVNRALTPYMSEAMILYDEGIEPHIIDQTAKEFGMPMGPLELADIVGLDVAIEVGKIMKKAFPKAYPDVPKKCIELGNSKNGYLGVKTGQGFYSYDEKGKKIKNRDIQKPNENENENKNGHRDHFTDRLILPMINACAACIRLEIVENEEQADAAMILATGFAPFRGGPMHYAKIYGTQNIKNALKKLHDAHGERFKPDVYWNEAG